MTDIEAMRAVDQTVLGVGNPRANCFQACLAMISGLPLEECIDITDPEIEDGQWIEPVEQWAASNGWRFVTSAKSPKDRPYIANGPTANRKGVHGVVCEGGYLFHDPHPSREGIVSANFYAWLEPDLATALTALPAEVARKDQAIEIAAIVFEEYARRHRAKGTRGGEAKAVRNDQYAAEMRAALKDTTNGCAPFATSTPHQAARGTFRCCLRHCTGETS